MRRSPRVRTLASLALAASIGLGLGCSGTSSPPPDLAARAVADAAAQLRGSWTLQSFTPEVSLEPMLQALLNFQFGRLVARFDGQRMVADSVGVHVERTYQITEAKGDEFKLTAFDDHGVPYEATCLFLDGKLQVHATTDPWRGLAILTRTTPAAPGTAPLPTAPGATP